MIYTDTQFYSNPKYVENPTKWFQIKSTDHNQNLLKKSVAFIFIAAAETTQMQYNTVTRLSLKNN